MRKILFGILLLILALSFPTTALAAAAGSCVFSADPTNALDPFTRSAVIGVQVQWVCTADSSGALTTPTITDTDGNAYAVPRMSGTIRRIQIVPGTGLSAGNLYLYSGADTTDDILQGLGGTLSTSNIKTDVPVTTTGKMPRELQKETPTVKGTGLGSGGIVTLKVLLRW